MIFFSERREMTGRLIDWVSVLITFLLKPEKSRPHKLSTAVDNFVRNYFHVYLNLSTR